MIIIHEFNRLRYQPAVIIYEDTGKVAGTSELADYFRAAFQKLRDDGYDPTNHMTGIKNRLRKNYRDRYHWTEIK